MIGGGRARGGGRRLADQRLGPERGAVRHRARPRRSPRRSPARGWPSCSGCRRASASASRPGATMASFTGIAAGRHALLARHGLGRRAPGPVRGARDPGRRQRRVARHDLRRAPDAGHGPRARDPRPDRRPGPDAPRRAARGAAGPRPAGARVRPGGQRQHRRVRPAAADRRGGPRQRRLAARRRRVRPVGGRGSRPDATSSRGSGRRTRGRPTPTSGSTSRTTRGSRSSPTRRPTTRR